MTEFDTPSCIALACAHVALVASACALWLWWTRRAITLAAKSDGLATSAIQQRLLDILQVPTWIRGPDLRLVYANAAYVKAVGQTDLATVLAEQPEIGQGQLGADGLDVARRTQRTGQEQTEGISAIFGGYRRLFQVSERPDDFGGITGFAEDLTALDTAQNELASHMSSHQEVLE